MRTVNRRIVNCTIHKRLAEVRLSEHDRQRAAYALRDAEAIVAAAIWVKERFAALGGVLLKPVFKH